MSDTLWGDNSIQFPRLIGEMIAAGAIGDLSEVAESMDLEESQVIELLERAQLVWDDIKSRTSPQGLSPSVFVSDDVLQDEAAHKGWTVPTMLSVALNFIDQMGLAGAFAEYVSQQD